MGHQTQTQTQTQRPIDTPAHCITHSACAHLVLNHVAVGDLANLSEHPPELQDGAPSRPSRAAPQSPPPPPPPPLQSAERTIYIRCTKHSSVLRKCICLTIRALNAGDSSFPTHQLRFLVHSPSPSSSVLSPYRLLRLGPVSSMPFGLAVPNLPFLSLRQGRFTFF
jgi:hypothetical protein